VVIVIRRMFIGYVPLLLGCMSMSMCGCAYGIHKH